MTIPTIVLTQGLDVMGHAPLEHPTNLYRQYPSIPPTTTPITSLAIMGSLLFIIRTRTRIRTEEPTEWKTSNNA